MFGLLLFGSLHRLRIIDFPKEFLLREHLDQV